MPASGIRGTHHIPLGSHLCLFYRDPLEFLQVTASFLTAGLAEQELCIWVLPPPLTLPLALNELAYHGVNGPRLQATQQLQITSAQDWFSGGTFNAEDSFNQLAALPTLARQLGYASVRAVEWNPAVHSQAVDRVHRIGQKRTVVVFYILTRGTLEDKIEAKLLKKKDLFDLTIRPDQYLRKEVTRDELMDLVKLEG